MLDTECANHALHLQTGRSVRVTKGGEKGKRTGAQAWSAWTIWTFKQSPCLGLRVIDFRPEHGIISFEFS